MKPKRIQRKRTKGWKMPENTVYVGRPTKWGNPFKIGDSYKHAHINLCSTIVTRDDVLRMFRIYALDRIDEDLGWLTPLRGKNLACFCKLNESCHADILLEIANR